MLSYFPTPYPEETIYSLLARYHKYSGNLHFKHTIKDLFGSFTKRVNEDFISEIGILSEKAPQIIQSPKDFIYNHTILPFYLAFIPIDKSNSIVDKLINNNGYDVNKAIGINTSSIINYRYLRHCNKCMNEDINKYGETYWHRIHQLPGVLICPTHRSPLVTLDKQLYELNPNEFLIATKDLFSNSVEPIFPNEITSFLSEIASEAKWVLENSVEMKNMNSYKDNYIAILRQMNIATINGRIDQKRWFDLFTQHYPSKLLSLLNSKVKEENSWLQEIVRKHRKLFHPIRHLLIINLLSYNYENFISTDYNYQPFGEGQWPCLNPVHKHYKEDVITDLKISICKETKRPIGIFTCKCGFIYSRSGPDATENDRYKKRRIIEFGSLWKQEMKGLSSKKIPIREIGRRLGVDSKTINHQLDLLEKAGQNNDQAYNDAKQKSYIKKQLWTDLVNAYPDKSLTELRKINNSLYFWLFKNDYNWLKQNSPINKRNRTFSKLDWTVRDENLLCEVKHIVNNWSKTEELEKPRRITKTAIANKTSRPHFIMKSYEKLPKTMRYINKSSESLEDFQIRRIDWVYNELVRANLQLSEWVLIRKAGIKSDLLTGRLRRYIQELCY